MDAGKQTEQRGPSDEAVPHPQRGPGTQRRRGTRYRRIWIGYWLVLFVVMHVPVFGKGPVTIEHADKLVHCAAYFLLAWLGGSRLSQSAPPRLVLMLAVWAVIYALYAGLDEWLQSYVGRTMSLYDWFADLAGIIAATVLVAFRRLRAASTSGSAVPGG